MAFAQVRDTTETIETSDTTSHDVSLTGVQGGDRLMLFAHVDNDGSAITISDMPVGWSLLDEYDITSQGGGSIEIWEKVQASGTEISFAYTTNTAQKSKNRVFMISGSDSTTAAETAGPAVNATVNPDPPSLTPSWGSDDTLWIACYVVRNSRGAATGYPTSYTDNQYTNTDTSSDGTQVGYGIATRENATTSEDPATFTKSYTDVWAAFTIAVQPSAATTSTIGQASETDTAGFVSGAQGTVFPSAPTGLEATSPAPDQVDLTWNPITGVTGYDIERDGVVIQQNHDETDFTDIGLTANTGYTYRVRGVVAAVTQIGLAEEVDTAFAVVHVETADIIGQAIEFDTAFGVAATGSGFGAGANGAALSIPAGAVTATPGTLASLINSNPGGTAFELLAGTYQNTFPNKAGNRYYGLPSDHTAVVFHGNATYNTTSVGGTPTGGAEVCFDVMSNNIFANFTVREYIGDQPSSGQAAPLNTGGASGALLRNILFHDNYRAGFRVAGSNNEHQFLTSKWNGRWAFAGTGTDNAVRNCDLLESGDNHVIARGMVPRETSSNRGACKIVFSDGVGVYNSYIHDFNNGAGLWWDIDNFNCIAWDNLVENITNFARGIRFELGHGGSILRNTVRNTSNNSGHEWQNAAILCATSGVVTVEDNIIEGCTNGIFLLQNNRDTAGDQAGNPQYWSAMCGSVVQTNIISQVNRYPVGVHCVYTKNGCHFVNNPSAVTIQNNNVATASASNPYWQNGEISAAQWAALGYG